MESDVVMPPVHPGEILLTEFLQPLELSQYQLARSISVPARRINEIVHGDRRISAATALRLARFFGTSERFWMNLQSRYDLEIEKDRLGPTLDDIRPLSAASLRKVIKGPGPRCSVASVDAAPAADDCTNSEVNPQKATSAYPPRRSRRPKNALGTGVMPNFQRRPRSVRNKPVRKD